MFKLFKKVPAPKTLMKEKPMPKTLLSLIYDMIKKYGALESANKSLTMRIKDLEDAAAARAAEDAEMASALDRVIGGGGSMADVNE